MPLGSQHDTVSERLRRWTRNPLGSARRGSNLLGVVVTERAVSKGAAKLSRVRRGGGTADMPMGSTHTTEGAREVRAGQLGEVCLGGKSEGGDCSLPAPQKISCPLPTPHAEPSGSARDRRSGSGVVSGCGNAGRRRWGAQIGPPGGPRSARPCLYRE